MPLYIVALTIEKSIAHRSLLLSIAIGFPIIWFVFDSIKKGVDMLWKLRRSHSSWIVLLGNALALVPVLYWYCIDSFKVLDYLILRRHR